jgi:hypothetical protein
MKKIFLTPLIYMATLLFYVPVFIVGMMILGIGGLGGYVPPQVQVMRWILIGFPILLVVFGAVKSYRSMYKIKREIAPALLMFFYSGFVIILPVIIFLFFLSDFLSGRI